jgi:predicted transcriptional regulator YdeE
MTTTTFVEPQIVALPALHLAGCRYAGMNEHGEVPQMWENQFFPHVAEVAPDPQHWISYGVARELEGVPPDQGFEYLAALEVPPGASLPEGWVTWDIPALTYAVVPAEDVPGIAPASDFFYHKWLPASTDYEMDAPLMIEIYKEDFSETQIIFLHFPVKRKKGA